MSLLPLAIPLPLGAFTSSIHFFQLAIFLCGILAGPWAGLLSGAAGSLYMGMTKIPFIVGGIALLGACAGLFAKRFRTVTACLLACLAGAIALCFGDGLCLVHVFSGQPARRSVKYHYSGHGDFGGGSHRVRSSGRRHRPLSEESRNHAVIPCSLRTEPA
jgi:hypothetical protein